MTAFRSTLPLLLAATLAACSTTASRIGSQQAAFDSYPAEVQAKIRAGEVGVGFTPEQTRLSLGEPSRIYERQTEKGASEIWAYRSNAPSFSLGIGGFGGGSTSVGGGVGVGTGDDREDKVRVVFEAGRVTAVERTAD